MASADWFVDFGRLRGVVGRVAAPEGVGRGLAAVIADASSAAVPPDEAGDLDAGEARHPLD